MKRGLLTNEKQQNNISLHLLWQRNEQINKLLLGKKFPINTTAGRKFPISMY